MRENLIVSTTGNNDEAVLEGLRWLVGKGAETSGTGLIAVNGFAVMERVVGRLLGEGGAKKLRAGTANVDGVRLQTMSDKRPLYDFAGPVFAIYPTAKLLDRLDDMQSITHLLVIPWLESDVRDWIRAWAPQEFGKEPTAGAAPTIADPIVRAAMNDLVLMINVGTGITHPSDKREAIEIFRCLKLNGVRYDPDEIRAWLVSDRGMDPRDANDVRDLANKILDGRTVQGAGPAKKNPKMFRMWVDDVRKTQL